MTNVDKTDPMERFKDAVHEIEVETFSLDAVGELLYLAGSDGNETRDVNCSTLSFLISRIAHRIEGQLGHLQDAFNDFAERRKVEGVNHG